jgi:dienelactone hydrolase
MIKKGLFGLCLTVALIHSGLAAAGELVSYKGENRELEGYFAKPKEKSKGLVVLIHDWDGIDQYEKKRVDMLAALGYSAFALDLYGKGNRPVEQDKKKEETAKLYKDRKLMRALTLAGINEAQKREPLKTVLMGYCFGGAVSLEIARAQLGKDIVGFATFHGTLKTPEGQSYTQKPAPIFIAHGGADSGIPMTDVATLSGELEKVGADYEIEVYSQAPHGFTVFDSSRYQEKADKKSWAGFTQFLEKVIR